MPTLAVSPVVYLEPLQERQGERGEVADGAVAARVVDEHRAWAEAAAGPALGEPVPLECAQEARRRRLRQARLLHETDERYDFVALDQPHEDARRAVDRLGTGFNRGHRYHIMAPEGASVNRVS